jgi:hypothetical protein
MNFGDIVLANTKKGFIVNAIKWFTNSVFSHSFVTMPDVLGFPMCIEACDHGVDMTRFDTGYLNNMGQGYEVWQINVDQSIKDEALKEIINDLETGYGFLEYPWFMWRHFLRFFGKDIKSQDNWNTWGMICSQLCVSYLKVILTAIGREDVLAGYGNGSISPQDLQDIFKANPDLFSLIERVRL